LQRLKIPKWLNVALGYGAEGMITGNRRCTPNTAYNPKRFRQLYLSLDVDLTKIKTNSHFKDRFLLILLKFLRYNRICAL
jgi:hypothetical protein